MRRLIIFFIVLLIIGGTIIVITPYLTNASKTVDNELIDLLKKADKLKYSIKFKVEQSRIIGEKVGAQIAGISGKYNTLSGIMTILGGGFSESAAIKEIEKIGLCLYDDQIGYIMAEGEEVFKIDEKSKFSFVKNDSEKKLVKITMVGDTASTKKDFFYSLELRQKQWIIVDEVEFEDMYSREDNWVAIYSSSMLSGKKIPFRSYCAGKAWDQDPKTAWVEGKKDDGIGEWIEFSFYEPQEITEIKIINGYAKSDSIYQSNNRVKRLKISFDGKTSTEFELEDRQLNFQTLQLPNPILVKQIRLTILEIYSGTKYHDTCISEIDF